MPSIHQLTIDGQEEFVPPRRINYVKFIDGISDSKPELLDSKQHKDLMIEFAIYAGLEPRRWGISLPEIKWVMSCGSNVERARRNHIADAY